MPGSSLGKYRLCDVKDRGRDCAYSYGKPEYVPIERGGIVSGFYNSPGNPRWQSDRCRVTWTDQWTQRTYWRVFRKVQFNVADFDPLSLKVETAVSYGERHPFVVHMKIDADRMAVQAQVSDSVGWYNPKGHTAALDSLAIARNEIGFATDNLEMATRIQNAFSHLLKLCKARVSTPF
jgi:hypothetical protein